MVSLSAKNPTFVTLGESYVETHLPVWSGLKFGIFGGEEMMKGKLPRMGLPPCKRGARELSCPFCRRREQWDGTVFKEGIPHRCGIGWDLALGSSLHCRTIKKICCLYSITLSIFIRVVDQIKHNLTTLWLIFPSLSPSNPSGHQLVLFLT